ncbi:MAG TPA: hypothetical protein VGL56_03800 [Fimbriimonadaceae bacterium]
MFARLRLPVILGAFALCALAGAQSLDLPSLPIHGIYEEYFETDPTHRGVVSMLDYLQLHADVSKSWRLVASYCQVPGDKWLEETYAEYDNGPDLVRLGRIRSDFGFSTWSQLYYTPMVMVPMIRSYGLDVVPGISLDRLDRGAEYETSRGIFQLQVAAVDSRNDDWHVVPGSLDTAIARLQVSLGPVLLGLNGLGKASDNVGPGEQMAGVDLIWTMPRLQVRGEVIKGFGSQGAKGYYADVFYRPPGLARTQVGARAQAVRALTQFTDTAYASYGGNLDEDPALGVATSYQTSQAYTFAARQFLTPNLTLSVNYGIGNNTPLSRPLLGWSTQLQFNYRF